MVKYEIQEQDSCFVIVANKDNIYWLVELTFEKNERYQAELVCKALNRESELICKVIEDEQIKLELIQRA